jgi:hypothetical protein
MAWILENILTLCYACHIHWWHKNPLEAYKWFNANYPALKRKLLKMSQTYLPQNDRVKIKAYLIKQITKYENTEKG